MPDDANMKERVQKLIKEAVTLLCKNSILYNSELTIEGLLGITIDANDVFLVNINESVAIKSGHNASLDVLNTSCDSISIADDDDSCEVIDGTIDSVPEKKQALEFSSCRAADQSFEVASSSTQSTVKRLPPSKTMLSQRLVSKRMKYTSASTRPRAQSPARTYQRVKHRVPCPDNGRFEVQSDLATFVKTEPELCDYKTIADINYIQNDCIGMPFSDSKSTSVLPFHTDYIPPPIQSNVAFVPTEGLHQNDEHNAPDTANNDAIAASNRLDNFVVDFRHNSEILTQADYAQQCPSAAMDRSVPMPPGGAGMTPLVCKVCGKMLSNKTIYVRHMKMHLGEFVSCRICLRRFARKDSLKRHLFLMHRQQDANGGGTIDGYDAIVDHCPPVPPVPALWDERLPMAMEWRQIRDNGGHYCWTPVQALCWQCYHRCIALCVCVGSLMCMQWRIQNWSEGGFQKSQECHPPDWVIDR